jgi:nitroimidazol reductase NimA-like FMN-containing flavoprotein (pyridoxamine 5'-phosphate oxidase superfamily)
VLADGKYAIVSMCRENEPYIVTLNYGFDEAKNALYFHCALKGLKLDFIRTNPTVCATVIEDRGYKKDECDHAYRSVVFWAEMTAVEDLNEKKHAMEILLRHLEENPDPIRARNFPDDDAYRKVGILRLDIKEITGKQGE